MSDANEDTTAEKPAKDKKEPKGLNTKRIKRRLGSIESAEPKTQRKKRTQMATAILRQIAEGKISNPVAAAKAFLESQPEPDRAAKRAAKAAKATEAETPSED